MTTAIYAGSFDPITNGHIDVIKSSAEIFDKVIVAVAYNINKQTFLPTEDRIKLIKECTQEFSNVQVDSYNGLTIEYARKNNVNILIRGLRNSVDFEYEKQLAQTNFSLDKNIKTVFFMTKPEYSHVSSSAIREIIKNNGDISSFVPQVVCNYFNKQY